MKLLTLLFMIIFFFSCGKHRDDDCRSREHMRLECRTVNQQPYGYNYAQKMCDETYSADRCY